jgi:L-fuconolactonase
MSIIDSHHHFWRYTVREYGWINDSMALLRRDFLPEDLKKDAAPAGVDAVISVQARQALEETDWLLNFAERPENAKFICGVVGWVPLISDRVSAELDRLIDRKKLLAVRHVLQDEPNEYLARDDFNRGIGLLRPFGLRYDILIHARQLPAAIELVDRHPKQIFVLDHVAKPRIAEGEISPWRERMFDMARRPNVYCKISGMVTQANHQSWTPAQLFPYLETALEAFGPRHLMMGSDWPVCLLACDYGRWQAVIREWIGRLSPDEQRQILGVTAQEAYGISDA